MFVLTAHYWHELFSAGISVHVNSHYRRQSSYYYVSTEDERIPYEVCPLCCWLRMDHLYIPQHSACIQDPLLWWCLLWKNWWVFKCYSTISSAYSLASHLRPRSPTLVMLSLEELVSVQMLFYHILVVVAGSSIHFSAFYQQSRPPNWWQEVLTM